MPALLVEQHVVMDKGRIVHESPAEEFRRNPEARRELLGVG
jgi:ABC-type branched-subunit amino acid transport system ATPase component